MLSSILIEKTCVDHSYPRQDRRGTRTPAGNLDPSMASLAELLYSQRCACLRSQSACALSSSLTCQISISGTRSRPYRFPMPLNAAVPCFQRGCPLECLPSHCRVAPSMGSQGPSRPIFAPLVASTAAYSMRPCVPCSICTC